MPYTKQRNICTKRAGPRGVVYDGGTESQRLVPTAQAATWKEYESGDRLEQKMPRPACAWAVFSAPLFLESVYVKKTEIPSELKQFGSVEQDLGPHCLQKK